MSVSEWWFSLLIICFVSLDLSLFQYHFVCFLYFFFAQIFGILEFFDFLVFDFFDNLLIWCAFSQFNPFVCQFFCPHSHLTDPNKQLQPASAMTIDKLESSSNALFGGSSSSKPMENLGITPMSPECTMLVAFSSGPFL